MTRIKLFVYRYNVVMTNGFALNHNKSLKIYRFCVKHQAKNDFPNDGERMVQVFNTFCLIKISEIFNIITEHQLF